MAGARVFLTRTALTVFFLFCMYPVSIGRGLGVNYAFLLLPFLAALFKGRLRYPGDLLTLAATFYAIVFFIATIYQVEQFALSGRRFSSFLVFMSMFSYAFITIDANKIAAFKAAVVTMSVYLSAASAYTLLEASAARVVGFEAKNLVGTQRIGYIYLIAFWLVYLDPQTRRMLGFLRYPAIAVLLGGLLLTFSRSSIVALFVAFFFFALTKHASWLRSLSTRAVLSAITTVAGMAVVGIILFRMFPVAFQFFDVRLLGFFSDEANVVSALNTQGSSEGTRLYIASKVFEFVVRNPLTGSGFLGVWTIRDLPAGSAHGQYMDAFFRTGPVGLVFYLFIMFRLLQYLWRREEPLFWGVLSAAVYGLFHETFKESQGGFVYAFLIGMMAQYLRDQRSARRQATIVLGQEEVTRAGEERPAMQ
jgi:hypothetical protein